MWKAINSWLRNFFGFSRSEANGFVILLLIMLVILFAPFINKQILLYNHPDLLLASDYQQLDSLLVIMDEQLIDEDPGIDKFSQKTKQVVLRDFDPNTATSPSLQSLGFPQFLADRLIKYRNMVKPFEKADDLLLIYGMDSSLYLQMRPYIKIKEFKKSALLSENNYVDFERDRSHNNVKTHKKSPPKFRLQRFDINTADTAQLKRIYGIGNVYAQRIIDYRNLLGGFSNTKQYDEIYGLKSPNLDSLKKYAIVDETVQLRQLKLNTSTEEELRKHPYISYRQAKLIVSYRNRHGNYKSVEDLMNIKVIDTSFTQKIMPYLIINSE